jgi:branched-chain amino acid transport system permease protein
VSTLVAALRRTAGAVREAVREARAAVTVGGLATWVILVAAPIIAVAVGVATTAVVVPWLALAVAAVALAPAVGLGGMPLVAQGALAGAGAAAYVAARTRLDWPLGPALLTAVVVPGLVAVLVSAPLARSRPAIAAGAWFLLAWFVAVALADVPVLLGGAAGTALASATGSRGLLAVTFASLLLTAAGARAIGVAPGGARLRAVRGGCAAAIALGVDPRGATRPAVALAGCGAGAAGALTVEAAGIADASTFGVRLSVVLLVAVVVGGARTVTGPVLGVALLAGLTNGADRLVAAIADPVAQAALSRSLTDVVVGLAALVAVGGGTRGLLAARRVPSAAVAGVLPTPPRRTLEARSVSVAYGDLVVLDGLDLTLAPGMVTALVGPNGAGKSTALAVLAGSLRPGSGTVTIDGRPVPAAPAAVRAGVARTLQSRAVPTGMTLRDAVSAAADSGSGGGAVRGLLRTPRSRAASRTIDGVALAALALVGLAEYAETAVEELATGDGRLLAIACAVATGASVLLLDEPGSGGDGAHRDRVAAVVRTLRDAGRAILLVEHDRLLVAAVADRVIDLGPRR